MNETRDPAAPDPLTWDPMDPAHLANLTPYQQRIHALWLELSQALYAIVGPAVMERELPRLMRLVAEIDMAYADLPADSPRRAAIDSALRVTLAAHAAGQRLPGLVM